MDFDLLTRLASDLGETAADPSLWPERLQAIAEVTGSRGAALLQSGTPTIDAPWSPSLQRLNETYYAAAWHRNDLRAMRSVDAIQRGLTVITDDDLVAPDEFARHPYYESLLAGHGLRWFAAVTFQPAHSAPWGLTIQRTDAQGAFSANEKEALATIAPRLAHAADLSRLVNAAAIASTLRALDHLAKPALAIGPSGRVVRTNVGAEALFDDAFCVRGGVLVVADKAAATRLTGLLETVLAHGAAAFHEPVVIRRCSGLPLIVRALPLEGCGAALFAGALALLLITDPGDRASPPDAILRQAFGLTGAEARLASQIAEGLSVAEAAERNATSRETVRSQLKSVLSKTGTRKQAALVGLLARL